MYATRFNSPTNRVVLTGLMAALALLLELFVHIPMFAEYLLYSPGDVPVIVTSVVLGPAPGLMAAFTKAALFVVLTGKGGPLGGLMHFVASGGMVLVLGLLARKTKGKSWVLVPAAILTRVALMVPMNLLITPIYTGLPASVIAQTLVPVVIPFNTVHAGINTVLSLIVLKVFLENPRRLARFQVALSEKGSGTEARH
ncbi:MAG TPA: ECF transporter S component [Firmicutes bacterium]|nr:ECF transporter S component [Candidatus Fermentithermobacillaceae bacterium]